MVQKTYKYRKHLFLMQKIMLVLSCVNIVLIILGILFQEILIILGIIFLIYSGVLYLFMSRFVNFKIEIRENELYYQKGKKEYYVPYSDIIKLENSSLKNTGGWLKIVMRSQKSLRITVVLEDVQMFTYDLKNKLDSLDYQNTYNKDTLFKFFRTSSYSNQSWIRAYYVFPRSLFILLVSGVVTFIAGLGQETNIQFANQLFVFAFIMFVYTIIELVYFARRHTEAMDEIFEPIELDENSMRVCRPIVYTQMGLSLLVLLFTLI